MYRIDIKELREPIPMTPPPTPQLPGYVSGMRTPDYDYLPNLSQSRLNQRDATAADISRGSILNIRYIQRAKSPNPGGIPEEGFSPTLTNGDPQPRLAGSRLNDRYNNEEVKLSHTKLNDRYSQSNGHPPGGSRFSNGDTNESTVLSDSHMNQRYSKTGKGPAAAGVHQRAGGRAARDQILRQQSSVDEFDRHSMGSANTGANISDMDRWLDGVFDPILDQNVNALSNSHSVERVLKGGGKGIPGIPQVRNRPQNTGALSLLSHSAFTPCTPSYLSNIEASTKDKGGATENIGGTIEDIVCATEEKSGSMKDIGGATEDIGGATEDKGGATEDKGGTTEDIDGATDDIGGTMEDEGGATYSIIGGTTVDGSPSFQQWAAGLLDDTVVDDSSSTLLSAHQLNKRLKGGGRGPVDASSLHTCHSCGKSSPKEVIKCLACGSPNMSRDAGQGVVLNMEAWLNNIFDVELEEEVTNVGNSSLIETERHRIRQRVCNKTDHLKKRNQLFPQNKNK